MSGKFLFVGVVPLEVNEFSRKRSLAFKVIDRTQRRTSLVEKTYLKYEKVRQIRRYVRVKSNGSDLARRKGVEGTVKEAPSGGLIVVGSWLVLQR